MIWFRVVDKFTDDFFKSIFKFERVNTDNPVFRLHYKLSIWLVFLYSICYTYVSLKNPISCITSSGANDEKVLNAVNDYCWVHGTYILTNADPAHQIYPGIGFHTIGNEKEIRHHHYYKWMYFYMITMIVLLFIPRNVWYSIENGRMRRLVGKLDKVLVVGNEEWIEKEKEMLVDYLTSHLGYHCWYSYGLALCELLNVLVSSLMMMMWDFVTDHEFSMHGAANLSYLRSNPSERTDRLAKIFPLLGKCTFNKGGPSGNVQPLDFICVLPLNIINERAAIFFWYYFMFLIAVGSTSLIYRLVIIISKRYRIFLLSGITFLSRIEDIELLTERCSYADWFVIYQMGSNIEPVVFRQVLQRFIGKLKGLPANDRV